MTTDHAVFVCPKCGADDSIEQSGGERLCLACLYEGRFVAPGEYDHTIAPDGTTRDADGTIAAVLPRVPDTDDPDDDDDGGADSLTHVGAPLLELLDGIRDNIDTASAIVDDVAATDAADAVKVGDWVHIGNHHIDAEVIDAPEGPTVTVRDVDGDEWDAWRGTLTVITADDTIRDPHAETSHATGETMMAEVMFAIASAILTTAADCVADDPERTFSAPSYGWAPPPANEVPEMELAAAYAVAIIIRHWDLSSDDVRRLGANLMTLVSADTETTDGETDNG